jgi:hypothetical protein
MVYDNNDHSTAPTRRPGRIRPPFLLILPAPPGLAFDPVSELCCAALKPVALLDDQDACGNDTDWAKRCYAQQCSFNGCDIVGDG